MEYTSPPSSTPQIHNRESQKINRKKAKRAIQEKTICIEIVFEWDSKYPTHSGSTTKEAQINPICEESLHTLMQ